MKNVFVSDPARPALISSSESVSLPLAPTFKLTPVATAPFNPPRPPDAHPVPFAKGVAVSPRLVVSAGFGVLVAPELVRGAGVAEVVDVVNDGWPRVKPVVAGAVVVVPNNPPVGAAVVVAGVVEAVEVPNNPPVGAAAVVAVGAEGVVAPNNPPVEAAVVVDGAAVEVADVDPNKPPVGAAVLVG